MISNEVIAKDLLCGLDPVSFSRYQLGFEPDDWQVDVLRSTHPRIVLNCSRQSGKSTLAAILATHTAYYNPGGLILLVSPSQRQSGELFRKASDFTKQMPNPPKLIEDNKRSLQLENSSRIVSLPGDPARIRGFSGPALIIEDEAAQVSDELFVAIRPMLAVSGGRLILLSTPFGKVGHFYEACTGDDKLWERYTVEASECGHIPREFLERERATMKPWEYEQEFECKFLGITNHPFHLQQVMKCLSGDLTPMFEYPKEIDSRPTRNRSWKPGKHGRRAYVGVDIGKEASYTAITIAEKLGKRSAAKYEIVHLERLPLGTTYIDVIRAVEDMLDLAGIRKNATLVIDRTGVGNAIVDFFAYRRMDPRGITITSGREPHGTIGGSWTVPRDDLIIVTQLMIQSGRLQIGSSIPLAYDLIEELTNLRSTTEPNTASSNRHGPYTQFDDLAMSTMLAIWYAENGDWREIQYLAV
jgi:hypothetical protein